ncbi:hypothetical protein M3J09_004701 [Ascochyta lentis]
MRRKLLPLRKKNQRKMTAVAPVQVSPELRRRARRAP